MPGDMQATQRAIRLWQAQLARPPPGDIQLEQPLPLPPPVFSPGTLQPSQPAGAVADGEVIPGKAVVAADGRRWELVRCLIKCIHGHVVLATQGGAAGPSSMAVVKILSKASFISRATVENPMDEVAAMQLIAAYGGHPNVLPLVAALEDDAWIYLVLPFCDGKDLFDACALRMGFTEDEARPLIKQVLDGLAFLHNPPVAISHRDMSLENVLLHGDAVTLVIDFGMCLRMPPQPAVPAAAAAPRVLVAPQGYRGKRNYASPEILAEREFDGGAIDVWAVGVMLYIMLTYSFPFGEAHPADEEYRRIAMDRRLEDTLREHQLALSAGAVDFIQSCLTADAARRPTMDELRQHPWVTQPVSEAAVPAAAT